MGSFLIAHMKVRYSPNHYLLLVWLLLCNTTSHYNIIVVSISIYLWSTWKPLYAISVRRSATDIHGPEEGGSI